VLEDEIRFYYGGYSKENALPVWGDGLRLVSQIPPGEREYILYLPLYNGVSPVYLGIPEGASLSNAVPRDPEKKPIPIRILFLLALPVNEISRAARPFAKLTKI